MKQFFLVFLVSILFFGCSSSNDSSDSNTQPPPNLKPATVNHHKSSIPNLVVMVDFANITTTQTEAFWSSKIFGTNPGEANDYYAQNSYSTHFQLTQPIETYNTPNDGIIKVTLSTNHPNISINSSGFKNTIQQTLASALNQADSYIDFSIYDANNDGYLQNYELNIIFIFAGYEDAYEGKHVTNGVWAHSSCFSASKKYDGVEVSNCKKNGSYVVVGEQHNASSPHPATIGIIVHELGHALFKLPDLYNTAGSYGGIGGFGLMSSGMWGFKTGENPGATPVHMCAWSKTYTGWITPKEVSGPSTLTSTDQSGYDIIKIPIDSTHYYLLENRSVTGYDAGFKKILINGSSYQGGILLWKINNNKLTVDNFLYNNVNADTNNKGVDVVEAKNPVLNIISNYGSVDGFFFNPNATAYKSIFDGVSTPASVMNINIK